MAWENSKFLNESMVKIFKIVAGAVIIGGTIASIAGSQIIINTEIARTIHRQNLKPLN